MTGAALLVAGVLQSERLFALGRRRPLADGPGLGLHIGYAFVPLGFLLLGIAALTVTLRRAPAFTPGPRAPSA